MKLCQQCRLPKAAKEFKGPRGTRVNCASCVDRMGKMSRGEPVPPLPRDSRLDTSGLRVVWIRQSQDRTIGPIPATYTSGSTCPDACSFRGSGCFAEQGYMRKHWRRAAVGLEWDEFCERVRALPAGQLWRHNIGGDLPGERDELWCGELGELAAAAAHTRGFTYTHKPLRLWLEKGMVRFLNDWAARQGRGLVINLSADGLAEADRLVDLDIGPVVVTVPRDTPRFFRTPRGRRGFLCPAKLAVLDDMTCARCGVCAEAGRHSLVGFPAHGAQAARVEQVVSIRAGRRGRRVS